MRRRDYEVVERHDLTEAEWRRVALLLPRPPRVGRPPQDRRPILNGILWILATGASWRDLPARYPPWATCYWYFAKWERDGTWEHLHRALGRTLWRDYNPPVLDASLFCLDSTIVRAHKAAAGAGEKRGRRAARRAVRSRVRAQSRRV